VTIYAQNGYTNNKSKAQTLIFCVKVEQQAEIGRNQPPFFFFSNYAKSTVSRAK
jgi:hypothetical protein